MGIVRLLESDLVPLIVTLLALKFTSPPAQPGGFGLAASGRSQQLDQAGSSLAFALGAETLHPNRAWRLSGGQIAPVLAPGFPRVRRVCA